MELTYYEDSLDNLLGYSVPSLHCCRILTPQLMRNGDTITLKEVLVFEIWRLFAITGENNLIQ